MSVISEFKEFAVKGNALSLAIGVIVGNAFGGIVDSLVKDIIMPPFGYIMGGVDFKDKMVILQDAIGTTTPMVAVKYGMFINTIINFLIVAFALFFVIKAMNKLMQKSTCETPNSECPPPADIVLLEEIRDLLKK